MADVLDGRVVVTTAGTRVQFGASQQIESIAITGLSTNGNIITIGGSTVVGTPAGSRRGITVAANQTVVLQTVDDLADLYADAVTNGEAVTWTAITGP